jgi:nucleoside 2-deoxyribosyltransferase
MACPFRPSVYFAGPDVFRRNAPEHYRNLVRQCEGLGMEALVPADGEPPTGLMDGEAARAIYDSNMVLLRRSDGVIANLAPFRGTEPDSGTVFEVGMAVAFGRPVVAYGVSGTYAERVERLLGVVRANGVLRDPHDLIVEDFGLQLNLMLACSVRIENSAEDALRAIAKIFETLGRRPSLN